jgi:hypothetical protein
MSKKYTCVLLYSNHESAEQDTKLLQAQDFDMDTVSIVSWSHHHKTQALGLYTAGGQMRFHGDHARFWENLWNTLNGVAFFWTADFGVLIAAGSIVNLLAQKHEDVDVGQHFSILGSALFSIGIPKNSIRQYEHSIQSENLLLIVHGQHDDVERACQLLHSKTQQVTVHMA